MTHLLHSILLTGAAEMSSLPSSIEFNVSTFKSWHPELEHRLYRDEELRQFILDQYGLEVVNAYDTLTPLSYRSDLGRFCLLYHYGGIYSDISNMFFGPAALMTKPLEFSVFRDPKNFAPWAIATGLIAAPPKLELFSDCISRVCEHVRNRYYGHSAFCPTGSVLFGKSIARHCNPVNLRSGKVKQLSTSGYPMIAFLDKTGRFVAIRRKSSLGMESLGIKSLRNYDELYRAREVYSEVKTDAKRFSAEDFLNRDWSRNGHLIDKNLLVLRGGAMPVLRGPKVPLAAGRYEIGINLRLPQNQRSLNGRICVTENDGRKIIVQPQSFVLTSLSDHSNGLCLDLTLSKDFSDLEVVVWISPADSVVFGGMEISNID